MNEALDTHPLISLSESPALRPTLDAGHLLLLGTGIGLLLAIPLLILLTRWTARVLRRWITGRQRPPLDRALRSLDSLPPDALPGDARPCAGRMVAILRTYLQETQAGHGGPPEAGTPLPALLRSAVRADLQAPCERLLQRLDRARFAPGPLPEQELRVCREEMRRLLHALAAEEEALETEAEVPP